MFTAKKQMLYKGSFSISQPTNWITIGLLVRVGVRLWQIIRLEHERKYILQGHKYNYANTLSELKSSLSPDQAFA